MDSILILENYLSQDQCDYIIDLYTTLENKYSGYKEHETYYNVICEYIHLSPLLRNITNLPPQDAHIVKELDTYIYNIMHRLFQDHISQYYTLKHTNNPIFVNNLSDTGYEIRKILGETRCHIDTPGPKFRNNEMYYRALSVIITLSDSDNELIFPNQDKCILLTRGTIVIFPPYWTHPHYTTYKTPRYSIQTWLEQKAY